MQLSVHIVENTSPNLLFLNKNLKKEEEKNYRTNI